MEYNTQIICALQMILSGDKLIRANAENFFNSLESKPLFAINLIQISLDQKFPRDLRLSASILVKNYVKNYWMHGENIDNTKHLAKDERNTDKEIFIQNEDKEIIRKNIFQIILDSKDKQISYFFILKLVKCTSK